MRARKFTITAFLLCALLVLGVGFAKITDSFQINGQAAISQDAAEDVLNNDVYFRGIVVSNELKSDVLETAGLGYTASLNVAQDTASYHVYGLKSEKDDPITITFQIQNDFDRKVLIESITESLVYVGSEDEDLGVFKATYAFENDAREIAANGGTLNVSVTIEVIKTPALDVTADFKFSFNAVVYADGEQQGI